MPKVSVVVPIFETEAHLYQCLDSIRKQTFHDIEIICVNDVTMDNSVEVAKAFRHLDSRFHIVHHEENQGLGGARNTGIANATGEFVQFVDSDDFLAPAMTQRLVDTLETTGADWAFCGLTYHSETDGTRTGDPFHSEAVRNLAKAGTIDLRRRPSVLWNTFPSAWLGLWRRDLIHSSGARFPERRLYEDHAFFYRYGFAATSAAYLDLPLYQYRHARPGQITRDGSVRVLEIFDTIAEINGLFAEHLPPLLARQASARTAIRLIWERTWAVVPGSAVDRTLRDRARELLSAWLPEELLAWKDGFVPVEDLQLLIHGTPEVARAADIAPPQQQRASTDPLRPLKLLVKRVIRPFTAYCARRLDFVVEHAATRAIERAAVAQDQRAEAVLEARIQRLESALGETRHNIDAKIEGSVEALQGGLEEKFQQLESALGETRYNVDAKIEGSVGALQKQLEELSGTRERLDAKLDEVAATVQQELGEKVAVLREDAARMRSEVLGTEPVSWHPTWIPSDFPLYFQGNIWSWADGFKAYARLYESELLSRRRTLANGLDDASRFRLDHVWTNYVERLPTASQAASHALLLRRDYVFSAEDLTAQREIRACFALDTQGVQLPQGVTAEIPAFHYHHGLRALDPTDRARLTDTDAIDCGAFVGDSALVLSRYPFRSVLAIDADAGNIARIPEVLGLNGPLGCAVETLHCGVGEAQGCLEFVGSGAVTTAVGKDIMYLPSVRRRVPVRTLDAIVAERGLRPGFIKLDVEGMEGAALRGAVQTLRRFRPLLAVSIYHTPDDFLGLKPWLESLDIGYRFRVERHNPFDPVYETMLLCFPATFGGAP